MGHLPDWPLCGTGPAPNAAVTAVHIVPKNAKGVADDQHHCDEGTVDVHRQCVACQLNQMTLGQTAALEISGEPKGAEEFCPNKAPAKLEGMDSMEAQIQRRQTWAHHPFLRMLFRHMTKMLEKSNFCAVAANTSGGVQQQQKQQQSKRPAAAAAAAAAKQAAGQQQWQQQ